MNERPTSITAVSWVLIILGGLSLVTTTAMINNPMVQEMMAKSSIPISVQYALSYVGLLVTIVSGVAILNGQNWARYLYVIWSFIGLVIGFATSPMKAALIPGLVVFLVIAFFLFHSNSTAFFVAEEDLENV